MKKNRVAIFIVLSAIIFHSSFGWAQEPLKTRIPDSLIEDQASSDPAFSFLEEEFTNLEKPQIVLTLSDVLKEAKINNQEIQTARNKWLSEKAKIWAARSWDDPELGVEFWGRNEKWYDVAQKVPFPGKRMLRGKVQDYEARSQEGFYRAKEIEILQKTKAAYYSYFLASRQIEIFRESVNLLKRFSKVAENKYSVNRASQSDVLKAQVEYFKSLNALVILKQDKEVAQAELNALLNRKPVIELGKPLEPGLAPLDIDYEDLAHRAFVKRPELQATRQAVKRDKTSLTAAWAEFLPDTYFQYSRRVFDNEMKDDNIFIIRYTVPFAWLWKRGSEIKSARMAKEQTEAELQALEINTYSDVKTFLVKTQTSRRLVEIYRTSVIPQAETALKVATAGYESGNVSFLDLLDSERTWLEFQIEYYQYLAQYWTYISALERVVGEDLVPFEGV